MKRTLAILLIAATAACWFTASAPLFAEPIAAGDAAAAPAAPAQPKEVTDAIAAFKANDYAGALKFLREACKKNADLPPAEVLMAQLAMGVPGATRAYLEQAVVEAPNDPEAYLLMADQAMHERRIAEANLLYEKAQSLLASFDKSAKRKAILQPRFLNGLATVAQVRGDWAGSSGSLRDLAEIRT